MTSVKQRIANREATIGMIGLGYVGLPLSLAFVNAGFQVSGFDIDTTRVNRLQASDSYVDDVSDTRLTTGLDNGFIPSASPTVVADCDVYIIAVPTNVVDGEPVMDAVRAAAETVVEQAGDRETLVIVSSTVYPGGTIEVVDPIVSVNRPAESTRLAMVPERLNPGGNHGISDIPLVIGANDSTARKAASTLFDTITDTVPVDAIETAELSKTLENTYRMVNIALVNQLVTLAEQLEADVWDAIEAAETKPFGFQAFEPGPGVGGHCIPIDPQFLTWRASESGTELPFIEHAHEINERMPTQVVNGVTTAIKARGVPLEEAVILAFGAAYKPNVGDSRNSPAIDVVKNLRRYADVTLVDPHVPTDEVETPITASVGDEKIKAADAVVLLVDHDAFDLSRIGEHASLVYDTKDTVPENMRATVVTLGQNISSTDSTVETATR